MQKLMFEIIFYKNHREHNPLRFHSLLPSYELGPKS